MRVLYVASEVFPLAKAGGLADVSAALPVSLKEQGIDVRLLMPGYPRAMDLAGNLRLATVIDNPLGVGAVRIWKGALPGSLVPVWLVECRSLYSRGGNPYQDEQGRDFADNALRFGLLSYVGAMIGTGSIDIAWRPDLIHINDWQTALLPTLLRLRPGPYPPTVLVIHNLAHQGVFQAEVARRLPLAMANGALAKAGCRNQISFLQAGILSADRVVTVSPTYATEIRTPDYGCGLDEILRRLAVPVRGILNGVDYSLWDPSSDPYLTVNYDPASLATKQQCKSAIQEEMGLDVDGALPLIAYTSRLDWQKMPEVVLEILPALIAEGIQFALVAEGDRGLEASFRQLAAAHPGRVAVCIGYEEAVAHRLVAGADIMLSPARYEPCGLTAPYAMRYGTPPVARRTGGLVDTVVDVRPHSIIDGSATGFLFDAPTAGQALSCVRRALQLFRQKTIWRRIQIAGMLRDFSWTRSARDYAELYRQMVGDCDPPVAAPEKPPVRPAPPAAEQGRDDPDRMERVRRRAYEIWEEQGRPQGRDVEHWLRAEAELTAARPAPAAARAPSNEGATKAVVRRRQAPKPVRVNLTLPEAEPTAPFRAAS